MLFKDVYSFILSVYVKTKMKVNYELYVKRSTGERTEIIHEKGTCTLFTNNIYSTF